MLTLVHTLIGNKRGVTAVEYGLIAALVAVAIIVAVTYLGTSLSGEFTNIATRVN